MTREEVGNWVRDLIEAEKLHAFYTSTIWLKLRAEVLEEDKHECQHCRARGFYKRANHVHHVNYIKKHPELAEFTYYRAFNNRAFNNRAFSRLWRRQ